MRPRSRRFGQERSEMAAQLPERRVRGGVRTQIALRRGVEALVSEQLGQLGKVFAERVDLPPDKHVRVNVQALLRGKVWRADEAILRGTRVRRADCQLPEALLQLGEIHAASASRSMRAALWLSATRASSGGM